MAIETAAGSSPVEPKAPHSFDLTAIDKTVDPCVNFYEYACGNWRKANPVPSDQVRWGRFNELTERNRYLLYTELKQASAPSPKRTPLERKYGDFFAACTNEALTNQKGDEPIQPMLAQIAALKDKKELAGLVAYFQEQKAVNAFYRFGSEQDAKDSTQQIAVALQGGLSLPDRDYYIVDEPRMVKIRDQYREYVTNIFKLIGDSDEVAAAETKSVIDVETALAKGSMPRVDMRDPLKVYHPMPVSDLVALAPDYDWASYFTGVELNGLSHLNVATPDFFKTMDQVVTSNDLSVLKSYLRFHVVNGAAPLLSDKFFNANFEFFGHELQGQLTPTPLWKRCTSMTDRALGEAVGQDWVKKNFPPDAKANMEKLVAALKKALGEDIESLPWMTDATKKEAEAKLAAFRQKIGYPEKWRDYSTLTVSRTDLVGNAQRASEFEFKRDLHKIGTPVDEKEWGMTPPTVNAYYDPSNNDINFPAGILQPPFFDNSKDPAVNFGAIGVVIGHEMTHGFDDQGSQFDGKGNLREWWTPEDRKKFTERTDCEVKEYGGFEAVPGQKLNGKLTLGENTADNGGLRIAYQALLETLAAQGSSVDAKIDGYTSAQRYFISFGQVWCQNSTDESARVLARTDPHSPGEWRVNGVVQNFDEFGKAFDCKPGQPMTPVDSCHVW
ncbi:MAG TPA: M13 family metallopeptidase [Acidisarcina sp.]